MSDIFGGSQIPAWLVAATHEDSGGLGKSIGTLLAGGLLGLQRNEEGDGLKGLQQGLAEARMNQADPTWRVKEKAMEAGVVSKWAMAASQWQQINDTNRDMATWTTQDLPAISKFQEELKTNPEAVPPLVQSSKGLQVIGQLEKQQLAMQQARLRQDNAKINLENQKTSIAFDQAVSAAPVGIGSAIDELPNQGWNLDRQGKRTTPSTAALKLYNDWATANGQAPEKAFGAKPNAAVVARIRGEEQRKVEATRGEVRGTLEEQRQENRKELEGVKQAGRVDLEKLRLSRVGADGKALSEAKFIDRNFQTVWSNLRKNAPDTESASQTGLLVDRLLHAEYMRINQRAGAGITATATNAPAASDKDPLGLFSK